MSFLFFFFFFFFNDTATTEIYTLSLHDALPTSPGPASAAPRCLHRRGGCRGDRKSTRLNSSHVRISYAVFCLKKKKQNHSKLFAEIKNQCKCTDGLFGCLN